MTTRYADGWEFDGRSEEYLRETFDLWAADTKDQTGVYRSGMRAIIEECHARAIELDEKRSIVRAGTLTIHTAGELHPAPTTQRMTFTFNLSDLLDDPAHKPAAHLIDLDGTDSRVDDFVFATEGAQDLYVDMVRLIARQLKRGKDIDVMVVCRGGKHRSVAFGENLAAHFDAPVMHHHVHLPRVVSEQVEGQAGERTRYGYPIRDGEHGAREADRIARGDLTQAEQLRKARTVRHTQKCRDDNRVTSCEGC